VHSFHENCTCGGIKCNTGCGIYENAQPADLCKLPIVQQGGLSETEVNVILVEEGDPHVCTRSTMAFNAARAFLDAVIIVARDGETELIAAVDSKSALAQRESLELEHVNIPVGVVTYDNGTCLCCYTFLLLLSCDSRNKR
jgi:hypothetical protein